MSTVPQPKTPLLFSAPTEPPYSLRRRKFRNDEPNTSEASSAVRPPPPTPLSPVCLKRRAKSTSTSLSPPLQHQGRKAPGSDAIPAELRKHEREPPIRDNRPGVSLLNVAGKIFVRIFLNRLNGRLEQGLLPENQCGFRRHLRTVATNFAARQLQEKCQKMRIHLYSTFVNMTKALDTVSREGLWKIMQKFSCPSRIICAMSMDAYRDECPGIRIVYRTDGQLQSRVSATNVHEILFADDCSLNDTSEGDMQRNLDLFAAAYDNLGLVINTAKMVIMHQQPSDAAYVASQINVNDAQPKAVDSFTYLCSALPRNIKTDDKVTRPRCQRTFRSPIGLIGHLRANCSTRTTPPDIPRPPLPRPPRRQSTLTALLNPPAILLHRFNIHCDGSSARRHCTQS
ncbi:hypothetical protein SprV_0401576100 [Sparganum proliferum]